MRRFGCPTGLGPRERVWLVFDGVHALGNVLLNDGPLGEIRIQRAAARLEVTGLLRARNVLAVDVELPPTTAPQERAARPDRAGLPAGLIDEVRLEIETD